MTTWQRRLRAGIALFGVAFAVIVYLAIRRSEPTGKSRGVERADPAASVESTGGTIRQLKGDKEDFRMEYGRSLSYADGRQKFQDVHIFADKRQGRDLKVIGREADVVGEKQDRVALQGHVELTSSDGLHAKTEQASYAKSDGVVRAPGALEFSHGTMSGTSVGMTYENDRDVLWLLDKAVITMAPDKPDNPPLDIKAGTAGFSRRDHFARFDRGFAALSGARLLESDQALGYLTDDASKLHALQMQGHARITGVGDGAGALKAMQAATINLEFADDGRTLVTAVLTDHALIQIAGDAQADRRIAARLIDIRFAPDGTTVTSLTARDGVRVDLPADKTNPARTIQSGTLAAKGEDGKGLTSATFVDQVEFREDRPPTQPGGPRVPRVARSRSLETTVKPGFSAIDDARFAGAVRFDEGPVHASAGRARYLVAQGIIELDGIDDTTGLKPQVNDDQVSIQGTRVALTMEGRKVVATDDVRSVMAGTPAGSAAGTDKTRRPSMLKPDQPVYATATSLDYDGAANKAVYTGGARLWQGDTAIQGDRIAVDDQSGDLTAKGSVRSALLFERRDATTKKATNVPTIGSADDLLYDEALHRATYTGNAHVAGQQGDLRADRIELYLKTSGNELERVEGYTKVSLKSDRRTGTGDRLTFFAVDERYLMLGTPVKTSDECGRETTGRTLTFWTLVDKILIDGTEERRTETKGGATCGGVR